MNLQKIKAALPKRKLSLSILGNVNVTERAMHFTDTDTSIIIKQNFGLKAGLHPIENLGLINEIVEHPNEFPSFNDFMKMSFDESIKIDWKDLIQIVKHSSSDETRLYLQSVAFNQGHLVATNGFHLKAVKLESELKENYIIRKDSIELLLKFLKGFKIDDEITVMFNANYAVIETNDFIFYMRLIHHDFLRWNAVVPKKTAHKFTIDNFPSIKDYKAFFNRANASKLLGENNTVYFVIPDTSIKLEIGKCDHDFTLGFNAKFLDIASEGKKEFQIKYNNNLSPVVVNDCIVMPLKL
jgi:DNA polymerase III sliding clamp (beta) subunit (PCNA family)